MKTVFTKVLFLCAALLLLSGNIIKAQTQYDDASVDYNGSAFYAGNGWAIEGQYGYDMPTGALSLVYKPTSTYSIGVSRIIDKFSFNVNVSHHIYQPKTRFAKTTDDLMVLGMFVGGAYNKYLSPNFRAYIGVNIGAWVKRYDDLIDDYSDCGCEVQNANFYAAPKAGFTYLTSSGFGIGLEAKYNIFVTGYDYATETPGGKLYNSIAPTVVLSYYF
ncbi:MAG: hypothetical protein EOP46_09950 [Sphingobacteriaceae bacterium]|nr:MAG: hypothetical protein EOP46_09950 [Sphingobacteriaceae bacterium]